MEKISRRKFLQIMGVGAAAAATEAFSCSDCYAGAYETIYVDGQITRSRCPHKFCKRYRPPQEGANNETYDLYKEKDGYCLSQAFKGKPRM